ncbi:MAG: hypothetical protein RI897_3955 [Verrucomicrobiota bacterium]
MVGGGGGIGIVVGIPVAALFTFAEEEFVEDVLDIDGTDVAEREDFGGEAVVGDRFIECFDEFGDVFYFCGGCLDDDRVTSAIGDHAQFAAVLVALGGIEIDIAGDAGLFLAEFLELLGDVFGVGVGEGEGAEDFFLGVVGIEGLDEVLDGFEVGFTGEDDEGVGAVIGGDLDGVFEGGAAHFLVEGGDFLDEILGADVIEADDAERDVLGFFLVEDMDEFFHFCEAGSGCGDDESVGGVIGPEADGVTGAGGGLAGRGGGGVIGGWVDAWWEDDTWGEGRAAGGGASGGGGRGGGGCGFGVEDQAEEVGELVGFRVFEGVELDHRIAWGGDIEFADEFREEADVVGGVGHDELVGAGVDIDRGFIGEDDLDAVLEVIGRDILEGEDLEQGLSAFGDCVIGLGEEFGCEVGFLAFGDDEDGVTGFDDRAIFEEEGTVEEVEGFAWGEGV